MELPKRKRVRLSGYDYSTPNYYYITICTYEKRLVFGEPSKLNELGKIAEKELVDIANHFLGVKINKYVVMPNHIHAIVVIGCNGEAERSRPFPTLSTIVGLYKSGVAKEIHKIYLDLQIWQKSFYDEIIRNEKAYDEIFRYIEENPIKWEEDELFIK